MKLLFACLLVAAAVLLCDAEPKIPKKFTNASATYDFKLGVANKSITFVTKGVRRVAFLRADVINFPSLRVGRATKASADAEATGFGFRYALLGAVDYTPSSSGAAFVPGTDVVNRRFNFGSNNILGKNFDTEITLPGATDDPAIYQFSANRTAATGEMLSLSVTLATSPKVINVTLPNKNVVATVVAPQSLECVLSATNLNVSGSLAIVAALDGISINANTAVSSDTDTGDGIMSLPGADGASGQLRWSPNVTCIYSDGSTAIAPISKSEVVSLFPTGRNESGLHVSEVSNFVSSSAFVENATWTRVFIVYSFLCPTQSGLTLSGISWDPSTDIDVVASSAVKPLSSLLLIALALISVLAHQKTLY